jgi:hypothetical protein
MENRNPILEQENYAEGYNKSIEELKHNPEIVEFDKLCYELFEAQEMGRKFIEHVTNRFLLAVGGQPGSPTFSQEVMWSEGVRYAFLLLRNSVIQHKQRIQAGLNK